MPGGGAGLDPAKAGSGSLGGGGAGMDPAKSGSGDSRSGGALARGARIQRRLAQGREEGSCRAPSHPVLS